MAKYRVDNLPLLARPFVSAFGVVSAAGMMAIWALGRLTVRIVHVNRPSQLDAITTVSCAWHENLPPYFMAALPYAKPQVWLNHPALYMKGIHYFLRIMRVPHLAYGSSGHGGRAALESLIPHVRNGYSTFLNPDGPHGPVHVVKNGVLDVAERTGAPVIALHIRCSSAWRLPTWDRKFLPKPFSTIEVVYSPPMHVTAETREAVRSAIKAHLDTGRSICAANM